MSTSREASAERRRAVSIKKLSNPKEKRMSHVVHFLVSLEREELYGNVEGPLAGDHVLIAVDGGKQGEEAIDWYFKFLHRIGNRVILVHAIETPMLLLSKDNADANKEIEKQKQEILHQKYQQLFINKQCSGSFLSSPSRAGDLIIKVATEKNITYIVMGAKAHSRFKRVITGHVTEYLMKYSQCPIIVAR